MEGFTFEEIHDKWTEHYEAKYKGAVQVNSDTRLITRIIPSDCILNAKFVSFLPQILDFEVYPDDTWIISFPKSGTTWTQEMVWLLKNNLDYEKAKEVVLDGRYTFLEHEAFQDAFGLESGSFPSMIDKAAAATRPRFIKTHLPHELLPRQIWTVQPKIIYPARDPKDVVTSLYNHNLWMGYTGSFDEFFDYFLADRVMYSPYWTHVRGYWKLRGRKNILINTFEEMKRDLPGVIQKTAKFLDIDITDSDLEKLAQHLSFESMKENDSVNNSYLVEMMKKMNNIQNPDLKFMNSGQSGVWKKRLTPEMIAVFLSLLGREECRHF